jgi:hypothetical protein
VLVFKISRLFYLILVSTFCYPSLDSSGVPSIVKARLKSTMTKAHHLRSRMLQFCRHLMYYTFNEVLEPHWFELETNLRGARTVDSLMQLHNDFLDTCLKECLLTNRAALMVLFSPFLYHFFDHVGA